MSRTIHLLNKRVALKQPDGGFQTSIDAVLLAAACPARDGESVLDLGCGVGAAGLCVAARVDGIALTGIEVLEREAALARENGVANVVCADIRDFPTPSSRRRPGSCCGKEEDPGLRRDDVLFDHVITNPPYLIDGAHVKSPDSAKAGAMGHDDTTLEDWIRCAHRNLKSKGSLTMVHRADALDEIIRGLGKMFGAVEIYPLWPKVGVKAKRVIVRALKDRHTPLRLHAGMVLHQDNGNYTTEAEAVLRGAEALL